MNNQQNNDKVDHLRHSAAHLLAAAVVQLYPDAKPTLGPAIENGFYYDFDFGESKVSESELPKIEESMRKIVSSWDTFSSKEVSETEAIAYWKDNQYKQELVKEIIKKGEKITFYTSGEFMDLCRGGHTENPKKELQYFKLLSIAGAYWRGDEKNTMLTRIYGTCFFTQQELDEYLKKLEEARSRDHKKLGKELKLFTFSETVGKGLPLWLPKGTTVRRILERFIVDEELKRGYLHVMTPDIANLALYKKSGHYPYYKDTMYSPIVIDDEEYMLRPMTCPHHFELYLSEKHSYRELPMRIAELAQLYRYEQSGELMGLLRVRTFCLADAHIICRKDQAEDEINGVLDLIDFITKTLGLVQGENYRYRLSLGDRKDEKKYFKEDSSWDYAEDVLRTVLKKRNADFYEAENEAAFYGPKIDVQMKNANGKEDTAFTIQYDFVMPKRFALSYTDEQGNEAEPVVVHRSSIGAIERSMAFLIEHYKGAFPIWLAPVQVKLLPLAERHLPYAQEVQSSLEANGIRVELDSRNERLQAKIRDAQLEKVPYMAILGDKEQEEKGVSLRNRAGEQQKLSVNDFVAKISGEILSKTHL